MKEKCIKVLRVEPKKAPVVCVLDNELDALQKAVSIGADYQGLIEIISLGKDICILCNEEGKLIGLEPNRRIGHDIICGVFYILGENENGDLVSLTEENIKYYAEYFKDIDEISKDEVENSVIMRFIPLD